MVNKVISIFIIKHSSTCSQIHYRVIDAQASSIFMIHSLTEPWCLLIPLGHKTGAVRLALAQPPDKEGWITRFQTNSWEPRSRTVTGNGFRWCHFVCLGRLRRRHYGCRAWWDRDPYTDRAIACHEGPPLIHLTRPGGAHLRSSCWSARAARSGHSLTPTRGRHWQID